MHDLYLWIFVPLVAYLIGGIPFGYLVARARGVNLFEAGSGNIGATNAGRVLGARFGILVFVLDFAKGAVPVVVAQMLKTRLFTHLSADELGVMAGLAAILGHLFPIYLRFRGGKGVATSAGVVMMLLPVPAIMGLLIWVGLAAALRYVSVASMVAAVAVCLVRILTTPAPFARTQIVLTLFCVAAALLVIVRHHANIGRLLRGQENTLREGPTVQKLIRVIHVLAVGLWFGTLVFFLLIGANLFRSTGELTKASSREAEWFHVPSTYLVEDGKIKGRYEYGTRIAGHVISPMFAVLFPLQGICGFLAFATAWGWQFRQPSRSVHRYRVTVLMVALVTVVAGWPLEYYVSELRNTRHQKMDTYFAATDDTKAEAKEAAVTAKDTFIFWHSISLYLFFASLILVTVAMGMVAFLPNQASTQTAGPSPPKEEAETNLEATAPPETG